MSDCGKERQIGGAELIATAGALSVALSDCADIEELTITIELLGLVKHNLEVIKHRRIFNKIEQKLEDKSDKKASSDHK